MFYYYLPALLSLAAALSLTSQAAQTHPQQQQQQQQGSQNLWDRIDVNKLDKELSSWHKESEIPSASSSASQGKQSYGDIPRPIQPNWPPATIQPFPPTPYPDPQPDPTVLPEGCLAPRGQFASWKSCSSYLNCWDGTVIEQQCPGGLLFNEYKSYCDFPENVYCGSRPGATPQPELQQGSKVCPTANGQYRSSTNCSEFYVCVHGKPIQRHCPRGLVYNDEYGICDYVYKVDCRGAAEPAPWTPPVIPHHPHDPHLPTPPPSYYPPQPITPPQYPSNYPTQYPVNPWLSNRRDIETDHRQQSPIASSWVKEQEKEEEIKHQLLLHVQQVGDSDHLMQHEEAEKPSLGNPLGQTPAKKEEKRCTDGEVHRLTESCSTVVVCENGRPVVIECLQGLTYDKPSNSCKPFTIAKWSV